MKSADSAHFAALFGTVGGFFVAHYDKLAAALCALLGAGYTLWKWRREIRRANREDHPLD